METLHINQLQVIESFINGENIFMSGPGGTGKPMLSKYFKNFVKNIKKIFK